jgi:cell division septation protein DedD
MKGTGKQSFYEIQLNNSSLIVAFAIAVALGIGVFMLGVMVGKGQAPVTPNESGWVEDSLATGDGSATTEAEPADPDLDFFEAVQEPNGEATQPAAGSGGDEAPPQRQDPPAESQPAAVTPPAGMPQHDPALATGWIVQVRATPQRAEADGLQAALAAAGFPAYVISAQSGGNTVYRVRVGRYRDRASAERAASLLGGRGDIGETWVTEG